MKILVQRKHFRSVYIE
uniref:Uncharacterized protein n=1 Tax=Arundo donax TaxID=35708 RepID=A0A0A9E4D3_ARUDO